MKERCQNATLVGPTEGFLGLDHIMIQLFFSRFKCKAVRLSKNPFPFSRVLIYS